MRPLTSSSVPRCHAVLLAGLLFATAGERALPAGVICRQECTNGSCAQARCDKAVATDGYSRCAGGSQPLGGPMYSCWCAAWGKPLASSQALIAAARDGGADTTSQPAVEISQPEAMDAAMHTSNPWVATLIGALHDGKHWAEGPVEGLVHDSHLDPATAALSHSAALRFSGQVTSNGLGAVQIDLLVEGDVAQLSRLERHVDAASPGVISPRKINGTVTAGGLHGSLQVTAADGRQQAIQW
jgi:hypothetical protein